METKTGNDQEIDNTLTEYFDNIKNSINLKFEEFNDKLKETKSSLFEIVDENLQEFSSLNNQVQDIQNKVADPTKCPNFKDEVKNLKKLIDSFIDQCEELEIAPEKIKDLTISEVLKVEANKFALRKLKLNCLKRGKKGKGESLKWDKTQKKNEFTLSEDDEVMRVTYSSCWNAYYADKRMKEGVSDVLFNLKIDGVNSYCCIGVANENYVDASNCFCQKSQNCFMLYADSYISINGSANTSNLSFISATSVDIRIILDLDNKKIKFIKDNTESQEYNVNGSEFRFVVGMCTSGTVTYKIVESDIYLG